MIHALKGVPNLREMASVLGGQEDKPQPEMKGNVERYRTEGRKNLIRFKFDNRQLDRVGNCVVSY